MASYPWNGQAQYQITVIDRKAPEPEPGPDQTLPNRRNQSLTRRNQSPGTAKPEEPPKTPSDFGHENPKTPQPEIQPVFRIGKILAWYQPSSPDGTGWLYLGPDGRWRLRLPKMGDVRHTQLLSGLLLLSAAGLGLAGSGTKRCGSLIGWHGKKKRKK